MVSVLKMTQYSPFISLSYKVFPFVRSSVFCISLLQKESMSQFLIFGLMLGTMCAQFVSRVTTRSYITNSQNVIIVSKFEGIFCTNVNAKNCQPDKIIAVQNIVPSRIRSSFALGRRSERHIKSERLWRISTAFLLRRAHDWTRTSTSIGNHPLKMACLPISPHAQFVL